MIMLPENIHGNHNSTCSHQKSSGNKIGAKIGAVPARPVGGGKQPGCNGVNGKSDRNNCNAKIFNGLVADFELFAVYFSRMIPGNRISPVKAFPLLSLNCSMISRSGKKRKI